MRVLHVIPSIAARDGGPSKAVIEMCDALNRRGHDSQIYTTNVDGEGRLDVPLGQMVEVGGAKVTCFPVSGGHYFKVSAAMAAELKKNVGRFELVHAHALYQFPSSAAAHYCRKYAVPYVLQPHGSLDPYLYRRHTLRKRLYEALIERRNLAAAAAVLFTSAEEMSLAKMSGLSFYGAVVPLGVKLDEPAAGIERQADAIWPQLAGKRVVLFLGRITPVKALDILAPAFGELKRVHPDVHLVIAGPDIDGYAAQVRGWLAEARALDGVTFTGMVRGEKKAALLSRANLFVLPSYSENFGIAAGEAMAAGLPVVISNRVKIWREIHAAGAGLVVTPAAGEVANAMFALLDNPESAKEMGERGRRLMREKFSWRAAGDQLVALYERIVHDRGLALANKESA